MLAFLNVRTALDNLLPCLEQHLELITFRPGNISWRRGGGQVVYVRLSGTGLHWSIEKVSYHVAEVLELWNYPFNIGYRSPSGAPEFHEMATGNSPITAKHDFQSDFLHAGLVFPEAQELNSASAT